MHRLCEYIDSELMEMERGVASGKRLSASELEYADKLAHLKKSILTNKAMEEAYDDDGYSRADGDHMTSGRRYSYAGRGRGRNARRDSMGRYSNRGGYSYDDAKDDMIEELRELMGDAPDEQTKKEFQRFISKMESM